MKNKEKGSEWGSNLPKTTQLAQGEWDLHPGLFDCQALMSTLLYRLLSSSTEDQPAHFRGPLEVTWITPKSHIYPQTRFHDLGTIFLPSQILCLGSWAWWDRGRRHLFSGTLAVLFYTLGKLCFGFCKNLFPSPDVCVTEVGRSAHVSPLQNP